MRTEKSFVIPVTNSYGYYRLDQTKLVSPLSLINETFDSINFSNLSETLYLVFMDAIKKRLEVAEDKNAVLSLMDEYYNINKLITAAMMLEEHFVLDFSKLIGNT